MSRREDQKLRTREQLLDAAAELFAQRGYHAVSVDAVAAAAGYTKGAVYARFADKQDLFLALLDRWLAEQAEGLTTADGGGADGFAAALDRDRIWNLLLLEFVLHALRTGAGRDALAARFAAWRSRLADHLPGDADGPWSVLALGIGLTVQAYLQPGALPPGLYDRAVSRAVGA